MMSIYDLEKQATPKPWQKAEAGAIEPAGHYSHRVFAINDAVVAPANGYGEFADEARSNAALIAHCRNNFLKALEFVKAHEPCMGCSGSDTLACGETKCLIAELEEVET